MPNQTKEITIELDIEITFHSERIQFSRSSFNGFVFFVHLLALGGQLQVILLGLAKSSLLGSPDSVPTVFSHNIQTSLCVQRVGGGLLYKIICFKVFATTQAAKPN